LNLAIMQPYFLPYLGYWQLLAHVERFVIYDDVNYMKGGWVNRNRVLINDAPRYLTVPLLGASANKLICETDISYNFNWRAGMLKTLDNTYRKAPFFSEVFPIVTELISPDFSNLSRYLGNQINAMAKFLGISTEIVSSSVPYCNRHISGQERVIDICLLEGATTYTNPERGIGLYSSEEFAKNGISLHFLRPGNVEYKQRSQGFCPRLSIIDTLMEVGRDGVKELLCEFSLNKIVDVNDTGD
jgi:WbqC-like protein family